MKNLEKNIYSNDKKKKLTRIHQIYYNNEFELLKNTILKYSWYLKC